MNDQDRQRLEALYRALPGDEPLEPGDPRYFPIYDDPKLTSEDPVEQQKSVALSCWVSMFLKGLVKNGL